MYKKLLIRLTIYGHKDLYQIRLKIIYYLKLSQYNGRRVLNP